MQERLKARLAAGQQAAFAELYDAVADRLHHFLAVRLGSRQDADDVLQETFVRLVRSRHKLRSVDNLSAYVFTAARNEANRFSARTQRDPVQNVEAVAESLFDETHGNDLSRRETAQVVARAIVALPPAEREVMELKTYAELTFREIAAVTGAPPGTVATRYRTALAHLRDHLTELMP